MNRLALVLLLSSANCLVSQKLKQENLDVYITHSSALYASNVSDFGHVDFGNARAQRLDPDGHKGEWQALKRGRGRTDYASRYGVYEGGVEVELHWWQPLDRTHAVVAYLWTEWYGSSNQSEIVQVFEWRERKIYITQQIEIDTHGVAIAGAWFKQSTKRLTAKAVDVESANGHCCPTHLNIVVFRWDGGKFRQTSARQVPMPPDKSG